MFSEWKEAWIQFRKSRIYPYAHTIARTALMYLIYALTTSIVLLQLDKSFRSDAADFFGVGAELALIIIQLIMSLLILNTVLLSFSVFSRSEREDFLKNRTGDYDKKAERKKLLQSPYFLTETVALLFLLLFFPCSDSVSNLFSLWLGENAPHPLLIRLIHEVLFGVPAILINLYGHLDARAYWLELPHRLAKNTIWKSSAKKKKQSYSYFRLTCRLMGYFLIYLIAGRLLPAVLMMFASLLVLMIFLFTSAAVLTVIGLIFSANYLGAMLKRRKFFKKLKQLCLQNGFTLNEVMHPYLSVFRETEGYTFSLSADGQTYFGRVISCVNRGNYMIFDEKGVFSRVKLFRIPFPRLAAARRYVHSIDRGTGEDRELFRVTTEVNYTFEADGKKLLILNPPSRFVKISISGSLKDADNGDHVGKYSIYSSNAFLRALERNAVL